MSDFKTVAKATAAVTGFIGLVALVVWGESSRQEAIDGLIKEHGEGRVSDFELKRKLSDLMSR